MKPAVTLLIPTYNGGPELPEILQLMLDQELDRRFETLVIDSGSTDGSLELVRSKADRLIEIPSSEFNHGLTRNLGIEQAKGEIVILASQDARPTDHRWMQRLVDCFQQPQVAGAYSRQLPRPDANPFLKDRLGHWAAAAELPREQCISDGEELDSLPPLERLSRVAFDNVSSAVRRSVALTIPFRTCRFGEDIDWGYRVILAGHSIVFEPRSTVIHSHNSSIWYELKRVYLDHQNLHRLLGVHTIPRWQDVLPCARGYIAHLRQVVDREPELSSMARWLWRFKAYPFGYTQNLAQYLGARSVSMLRQGSAGYRLLDRVLGRGV